MWLLLPILLLLSPLLTPELPTPLDAQPQIIFAELAHLLLLPPQVDAPLQIIFVEPLQLQAKLSLHAMRLAWQQRHYCKQQLLQVAPIQLFVNQRMIIVELPQSHVQITRHFARVELLEAELSELHVQLIRHFARAELLRFAVRPVLQLRLLLTELLLVQLIRHPARVGMPTLFTLMHMMRMANCCRVLRW